MVAANWPNRLKAHADGADFRGEDLADVQVHGGVAEGALEGEVQEDNEDTTGVAAFLAGVPGVGGKQGAQYRNCNQAARGTKHVHEAPRVDAVVKPGATRVVEYTWCGTLVKSTIWKSRLRLTSCG